MLADWYNGGHIGEHNVGRQHFGQLQPRQQLQGDVTQHRHGHLYGGLRRKKLCSGLQRRTAPLLDKNPPQQQYPEQRHAEHSRRH